MTIEIANRLVELRKSAGLSQEELSQRLGISRQAISKWEQAESSPDTDNLIALSRIYGISIDELLSGRAAEVKPTEAEGYTAVVKTQKGQIGSAFRFTGIEGVLPAVCCLSAELENANIYVTVGEVAEPQVELSGSEKLIETCTVTSMGDTVYVKQQRKRRLLFHNSERLIVNAVLPRRMRSVSIDVGGGLIDAEGVTSDTILMHTGGGGLKLRSCMAEKLSSVTGGGGNSLMGVTAKSIICTTGGGGIELKSVRAETADIKTGGGGLNFEDIDFGSVTAKTGGGGIEAEAFTASDAELATGGGGIEVKGGSIGTLGMRSGGGSLTAELDELGGAVCTAGAGGIVLSSRRVIGAAWAIRSLTGTML